MILPNHRIPLPPNLSNLAVADPYLFQFNTDISTVQLPNALNNPFGSDIPEIGKIAAVEFHDFIAAEAPKWKYDFDVRPGKMFGILVVQKEDHSLGYIGTVSGKLPGNEDYDRFVPSIFDESKDDYFLTKGLTTVTEIGKQITAASSQEEIATLKAKRSQTSKLIQQQLFESYHFVNLSGREKNLLDIFQDSSHGKPPAATGECAAPKLLHYAIKQGLNPVAIAEFWWGNPLNTDERKHKLFYPACKSKCRPILEYMLENNSLYVSATKGQATLT